MAKLVVLSEGMTGQSYELKVDRTTIGRVDDNTFPIPQPSVSSHHCEIYLRGTDVVVKDLNSTNGTFVNNLQVTTEAVIKPGQILRLGQVEIRLEAPGAVNTPASPAAPAAPMAPSSAGKRAMDSTMVISKGVSLEQLEQGPQGGFDTTKGGFSKKVNKTNKYFIWGGVAFAVIIVILFLVLLSQLGGSK
jgi:pSer/pThr/pTyr-binding forkhead associated (FHA) protein